LILILNNEKHSLMLGGKREDFEVGCKPIAACVIEKTQAEMFLKEDLKITVSLTQNHRTFSQRQKRIIFLAIYF